MRFMQPKVILLASTALHTPGVVEFLESVGAPEWATDAPSDAEALTELAGRTCYRSWAPGLNANVTKVREGNADYINNLLRQQHWSVLEHAQATFAFLNVSRVFTHELVRHRHLSFSQESLRYVRLTDLSAYLPEPFAENDIARQIMIAVFETCEEAQRKLAKAFDLDQQDFATKKQVTSAMRRYAPIGLTTSIIATGNLRTWREVIEKRCTDAAEEEIASVIGAVRDDLRARFPNAMGDL